MPIPILVTGKAESVGSKVIEFMKPEYEVIHFVLVSAAEKEVPLLLKSEVPSPASSSLGTGNWSSPPRALLLGGAYEDADIERLRELSTSKAGARQIPWLHIDSSKPAPPPGPEYAKVIVGRLKEALKKLEEGDELKEGNGKLYLV